MFAFPEYFGRNWAAFEECIKDLSWLPAVSYLTVVVNFHEVLADDADERDVYLRTIASAGEAWGRSFALPPEWGGREVPFNTILIDQSCG